MANKDSTVVSATLDLVPSNKVGKTLSLTVRGSEAKFGWRFPTVRYAVNRLTIHLDTDDCILPEEDWNLDTIAIGVTFRGGKAVAAFPHAQDVLGKPGFLFDVGDRETNLVHVCLGQQLVNLGC